MSIEVCKELYTQHQETLFTQLGDLVNYLDFGASAYNPYPFVFSASIADELQRMGALLLKALNAAASGFLANKALRRHMPMPGWVTELLIMAEKRPYRIGMFRPDLLFVADGGLKICEINGRFIANGMILSQKLAEASGRLAYLADAPYQAITPFSGLIPALLSRFDPDAPVTLLLNKEPGNEIRYLLQRWQDNGGVYHLASPKDLQLKGRHIVLHGQRVAQFILELKRDELRLFATEVLRHMVHHCTYINDLRTLLVIHDKRLPGALLDPEVVHGILTMEEHAFLSRFLLPSHDMTDAAAYAMVRANPKPWVAKRISSGRGEGMHIGNGVSLSVWQELLAQGRGEYLAQQFVPQRTFPILTIRENRLVRHPMQVVATLPGFDQTIFGPGILRSGVHDVINMHGGRGQLLMPMVSSATQGGDDAYFGHHPAFQ